MVLNSGAEPHQIRQCSINLLHCTDEYQFNMLYQVSKSTNFSLSLEKQGIKQMIFHLIHTIHQGQSIPRNQNPTAPIESLITPDSAVLQRSQ
jgi:hypothetical protein